MVLRVQARITRNDVVGTMRAAVTHAGRILFVSTMRTRRVGTRATTGNWCRAFRTAPAPGEYVITCKLSRSGRAVLRTRAMPLVLSATLRAVDAVAARAEKRRLLPRQG